MITNTATTSKNIWQRLNGMSAYHWVLLSQFFVVLFHHKNLPSWLFGYALVIIIFLFNPIKQRLPAIFYRKRSLQLIQILGFFAGVVGLYVTYRTALGLDVGIAFLLLCAVSKLLELHTRRDAYVVLSLSLFVLAGLFLIDQSLLTTLQVFIGTLIVLLVMIAQNDDDTGRYRTLGLLVLQALPLMLILFLFFPRLPPLWAIKISSHQATTGMSDSMSPGDFANLSRSTELAFRAEFQGNIPNRQELYWRGLVFSDFDGTTWRQNQTLLDIWTVQNYQPKWLIETTKTSQQPTDNYQIILEKTGQPWLFALDYPYFHQQQRGIGLTSDFTLRYWDNVSQRLNYQVQRLNQAKINLHLSENERQINLQLPVNGNRHSRQFAQKLFNQVNQNPISYINAVQQWIQKEPFRYTLSPPLLKQNRVDEFLFNTKAGFCEHYSSSFTFLMRAVGIPARVVVGYQGGQIGRDGISWEVRQMDAHAWTEVWLEGQGWTRIDPTSFVSPDRVEQGMDTVTQKHGAEMFGEGVMGELSYQQFQLLQEARRLFDQASYYWQRDVVGFDQDKQKDSLFNWLNIQSIYQQIAVMAVSLTLLLSIFMLWLWWKRRKVWNKTDLLMIQLSKQLAKQDKMLARQDSEGVLAWLDRIANNIQEPENIKQIQQIYRKNRYSDTKNFSINSDLYLRKLIKQIKLRK